MSSTKVQEVVPHTPVLLREICDAFEPLIGRASLNYFDGTFGRGGHYQALLKMAPQLNATAFDQDVAAIEYAQKNFATQIEQNKLRILHTNFSQFPAWKKDHSDQLFDFMLLDLGVSSPQLDEAERGFSFYHDGPLDMRMNQTQEVTAEYIINTAKEEDLIRIFKDYGEVYSPFRVVRAICHDRKEKAFQSTLQLAGLIERVDGWRVKGRHPATQYFMALRLAVNAELDVISEAVPSMIQSLTMGGRIAVISFHSLEDRIIKNLFKDHKELGYPIHKKVIIPTEDECEVNPRSRSAKLRVFERGAQDEPRKYSKYKTIS